MKSRRQPAPVSFICVVANRSRLRADSTFVSGSVGQLAIDGVAYGLSPFGGLITYWDEILPELAARTKVRIRLPPVLRAVAIVESWGDGNGADVFVSTYFTQAPAGMPNVVVVHDTIYEDSPGLAAILEPGSRAVETKRACIMAADAIIVPSLATADGIQVHYPELAAPVEVIPHGVAHRFRAASEAAGDLEAERLLESHTVNRPFVLYVGSRHHYKNFDCVLRAFASDARLKVEFALVAVGGEPDPSDGELAIIRGLSTVPVRLLGRVSPLALAALYRRASVLVSASRVEGFGLPVLEGVACGTSVACSNIRAHRETASDIAVFFDPDSPRECADAILEASMIPVGMRHRASEACRCRHSWPLAAERFMDVCRRAVAARAQALEVHSSSK